MVFHAPPAAPDECSGGIFVKRIIGLPGEVWSERDGVSRNINAHRLVEPYVRPERRDSETSTMFDIRRSGG